MEQYTLNDLERLTGIRSDTIRMWERRYGISTPGRTASNRRWYSGDDLRRLINISVLNRSGMRISEIAGMTGEALAEKAAAVASVSKDNDILLDSLVIAMTLLDEAAVNEILLRSVIIKGFEKTFSLLVFPFMRKVGILWHTGFLSIGAEHFISNIFRRKLISAFDNLSPVVTERSKRVIMFLPEKEYHELGLLYYAFIVRSLGHIVLYLGQATPTNAVIEVAEKWNPEIIITGALSGLSVKDPDEFIMNLSHSLSDKRVLFAGSLADIAEKKKIPGFFACRTEKELQLLIK